MKILLALAACVFWLALQIHAWAGDDVTRRVDQGRVDPVRVVAELLRDLHYDGPPPEITWVDPDRVIEACNCRPPAFYRDGSAYLSLALDLDSLEGRAVLLHELVHHIQWVASGPAADCYEWQWRERLAHDAQNAWLAAQGSARRVFFTGVCQ